MGFVYAKVEDEGKTMIEILNRLIDHIEAHLDSDMDIEALAEELGTTGYHARRMFASLAGMPVSEYIRRRRMTLAATDLLGEEDILSIAIRYGYSSSEAFGRAFRNVHSVSHGSVRRNGGPLRSQPKLRFRLTVEGSISMDTRITQQPHFRLIGYTVRVPLIHRGANPYIQQFIESLPGSAHSRLKQLSNADPAGILQISNDGQADYTEGSELTYMHGVAVDAEAMVPENMEAIDVSAGSWAVFSTSGAYPSNLQSMWAATATEWFPSNPWRLRPGPSMVAILERAADFSTATCELWLPIERA